jgi:hypothetical protein
LVDASAALAGYASCDDRAEIDRESYLSAFQYDEGFRHYLSETRSTAGFNGTCWARWIWIDIDAENDVDRGRREAAQLVTVICAQYGCASSDLLVLFSGAKGFHVGIPTTLWKPTPSTDFHKVTRCYVATLAETASINIDLGVYDKVRAFRAPNSRHPKTGLHKRFLPFEELSGLCAEEIRELAREPAQFQIPSPSGTNSQAIADWQTAIATVNNKEVEATAARRFESNNPRSLNRETLEFICHGATPGERAHRLFSAAANLGEFGCEFDLAWAILREAALDSGLPPHEARRQVECGLKYCKSEY